MNAHARTVLEYETTLERVAARAGSLLGREAVLRLRPGRHLGPARRELDRVGEVMAYLGTHPDWAPPLVPEAGPPLRTLEVDGGVPSPAGFLLLATLLEGAEFLARALEDRELAPPPTVAGDSPAGTGPDRSAADFPHLRELRSRLVRRPELLDRIRKVIDVEGEVRDDASPALRSLRGKLRGARSRIVERLERFVASLPERIRVPDASVSVREGRYVIPIRREGMREVGGIVHGESASGATIFVEPPIAIRLMNEIHELEREVDREIQRVLRQLSAEVRPAWEELATALDTLVDFDSLYARARTAESWGGTVPELVPSDDATLRVVQGRHPLLLEQDPGGVIPFDLELEPGERALVVSGPNTGGKTVLLKSIGLFHLLAQAGIVPPVGAGTRLPLIHDVFADIGDGQSIAESLSTFSSHLARMHEILEDAGPGSLVLVDEMGTGTDPAEGAALARAILETLVERGVRAVVTSHLGALKRLDTAGSGIVNASLRFDAERIEPTYRFSKGRPGRSYGLAIAARSGLPASVLELARSYVDSGELEVENLLADLEGKERRLTEALRAAEEAEERARRLEVETEARERDVRERERMHESRAREEARRLLLDAREEVEEAIRTVRSAASGERSEAEREARRRVEAAASRQRERRPRAPVAGSGPSRVFEPGEAVRVAGTGARGTVREVRDERALVEVGGMRMEVSLSELELLGAQAPPKEAAGGAAGRRPASGRRSGSGASRTAASAPSGATSIPDITPTFEADLRGLRVDEVELELGRAVDAAVLGGLSELRIIHGKGTGAVKARVLELLPRDPRVQEFRPGGPGEGGGGVTVAALR